MERILLFNLSNLLSGLFNFSADSDISIKKGSTFQFRRSLIGELVNKYLDLQENIDAVHILIPVMIEDGDGLQMEFFLLNLITSS